VLYVLEHLKTADLEKATDLQNAAINYYGSLKALHMYAKKEIAQQKLIANVSGVEKEKAQDQLIKLAKDKQVLYDNVYQTEEPFHNVLLAFEDSNGLR
jgi:dTDP-4-dehydrorhamnose 3,5-epimerase-like enzyme